MLSSTDDEIYPAHHVKMTVGILTLISMINKTFLLSTKFILLINVKMPTVVGILTLISMKNKTFILNSAEHEIYPAHKC